MKWVFLVVMVFLVAASAATIVTEPDLRSEVPVIYWMTDRNPDRVEQVDRFHQWLVQQGYTTESGDPVVELRLDVVARDPTNSKKIIQSVAGVAGDIMDCDIGQMHGLGVILDVTDYAQRLGFGLDRTYQALEPVLMRDGRQYGFPCNVGTNCMWVNVETFKRYGLDLPPQNWTIDQFEAIGREFITRANKPGERQRVFYCANLGDWQGRWMLITLIRGFGLSVFNETMTAADVDDPRFALVLNKFRQWTYEDHFAPTGAEVSSFSSQAGYGGIDLSLFETGRCGIIITGRWALIRMREYRNPPQVQVVNFPMPRDGFPNAIIGARSAAIYKGSDHPDLAALFLAFLASDEYNQHIVAGADGLPPSPLHARSDAYNYPPEHPNEWGIHKPMYEIVRDYSIAMAASPFVSDSIVQRHITQAIEKVLADPPLASAEEAARVLAEEINEEIMLNVRESSTLSNLYQQLHDRQARIDAYRAEGRPVPLDWITNPFYREYYRSQGWLDTGDSDKHEVMR